MHLLYFGLLLGTRQNPLSFSVFLQFSQLKADGEVRWAVLNVAAMLRQYEELHRRLANAMDRGRSVGELLEMMDAEVKVASETAGVGGSEIKVEAGAGPERL